MKAFLLPVGITAIVVALTLWVSSLRSQRMNALATRVAEFFLVDADGFRLGATAASSDIVLVMYDKKSAEKLGHFRSYEADIKLFRNLVSAKASVVYDSRNLAIGSEDILQSTRPLLDMLFDLNKKAINNRQSETPNYDDTVVVIDAWLPKQLGETDMRKYAVFSAMNPLPVNPHKQQFLRERLFPLGYFGPIGLQESAPFRITRLFWKGGFDDISLEFARCGILTEQFRQFPKAIAPFAESYHDYQLMGAEVPWTAFEANDALTMPAGLEICHSSAVADYRTISYVDALESQNPDELALNGKIVIVGYGIEEDPTADIYQLPSSTGTAGSAHIVALATQTLLEKRWKLEPNAWVTRLCMLILCCCMMLAAIRLKPVGAILVCSLLLVTYIFGATVGFRVGWKTDFLLAPLAGLICGMSGIAIQAWNNIRSHLRVVDMFGRYVPRAVVNQLILQPELDALKLGGSKREVTVLFADIRGFTSFSEKMPPDQVVAELNSLLKVMVDCTFEYQGTLDKFIGDAILVLFNAPLNQEDHVQRAVKMALEMQSRIAEHSTQLSIGIGIHMGEAVVGNIGTPQRMEYTAIGSTVNIASRLCDQAQAGQVVVSQQVYELVGSDFQSESLGGVKVKGITEPISMWSFSEPFKQSKCTT